MPSSFNALTIDHIRVDHAAERSRAHERDQKREAGLTAKEWADDHQQHTADDEEQSAESVRTKPDVFVGERPRRANPDEEVAADFRKVVAENNKERADEDGDERRDHRLPDV